MTMTAVIHVITIAPIAPKIENNKLEFIDPLFDGVTVLVNVDCVPLVVTIECILLELAATYVFPIIFDAVLVISDLSVTACISN